MTPSDPKEADALRVTRLRRLAVYVVAGIALLIALWSLTQGADRDLFRAPPSAWVMLSYAIGGA